MGDQKEIVVIIRHSPLNSIKDAEALRMSVGLTLADDAVTAILVEKAAWLAVPLAPSTIDGGEITKPINTLGLLGMKVKVEEEALAKYGIDQQELLKGIEVISRAEIAREIAAADAVVVY